MNQAIRHVDVAIVGAGTAGLRAYKQVREHTDDVVVIDPGPLGTTCARVGCMPSKLLIAAAHAAHDAGRAWQFGSDVRRTPEIDGTAVMDRVRRERDRFVGFLTDAAEAWPERVHVRGRATFVGPNTLQIDGEDTGLIRAAVIILATGSRPVVLPFLQGLGDRLLVNDDVFDWTDLPASVAVFGPGVIGLELGQALHRLGVRVRVFGVQGLVGPLTDPAVRDAARRAFAAEFHLHDNAQVSSVAREGDEVVISWTDADGAHTDRFAYVLSATGRRPNTDRLGLPDIGVPLDRRGLPPVDPGTLQVDDRPILLAGDALGDRPILHEAADEGVLAGRNAVQLLRHAPLQTLTRRSSLAIVFSDPGIAMVGTAFRDLPSDAVVGEVSYDDQGRSRVMLRNQGLLRVYADRQTGRLLGAEMVGPDAEHLAHLLAWAHQTGLTVAQMLKLPFYHPVVEEGVRTALQHACAQLDALGAPCAA